MAQLSIDVEPHPLLRAGCFVTSFPRPLADLDALPSSAELLDLEAEAPLQRSEDVRKAVRDLLRHGGYRPTGRGKPASEYLVRAVGEGALASINPAVDACNVVSLHSGLPISVVDLDRAVAPLRIAVAPPESSYAFNASGQEIRLDGLLCLFDAEGPCANAVKDSQRTKTGTDTVRTLSVVWSSSELGDRLERAVEWYRSLLEESGASTEPVPNDSGPDGL